MKRFLGLMLWTLSAGCTQVPANLGPSSSQEISSEHAAKLLDRRGLTVIDVRSSDEKLTGRIPGAVEVMFGPSKWTERSVSPEDVAIFLAQIRSRFPVKDVPMIVFCNVGVRSRAAAETLASNGYEKAMSVKQGFLGNRFGEGLEARLFSTQ